MNISNIDLMFITRRTAFDLDKAEKRAHILKGYTNRFRNID